jgi:myo-inositol-1(or 4)-monophosphatase
MLGTAFRAALIAGDFIVRNLGKISGSDIDIKQASDYVTRIDMESEKIIIDTISAKFPGHHFLAEESAGNATDGEYRWIIDPLDGTTNFIHTYPVFAVSIGLQFKGDMLLGLVYDPLRHEMFAAVRGEGATLNGSRITCSLRQDIGTSLVATGFPFRKKEIIAPYLTLFRNIFNRVSDIRRAGSAALDLVHVAAGRCDCFFEIGLSPWDMAAGSIIIEEAGGVVTDFGGGKSFLETGNIVCGTPVLQEELLLEVKKVFRGIIDY